MSLTVASQDCRPTQALVQAVSSCIEALLNLRAVLVLLTACVYVCRESAAINSSLTTLGRCLEALRHNQHHPTLPTPPCAPFAKARQVAPSQNIIDQHHQFAFCGFWGVRQL